MNILIVRGAAIGDVLCTEPIIRKLTKMGHRIHFRTIYPGTLMYNKNIITINEKSAADRIINLNMSYERMPMMHIIDAYSEVVRKVVPGFVLEEKERIPVYNEKLAWKNVKKNVVTVNSEGSWSSRTYDVTKWKQFIRYLKDRGNHIVEIGSDPAKYLGIGDNFYGKLKLNETVELMMESDLYVGMDGGLMHFAQSIGLPMFIIFGCTCPVYRIHNWNIAKVLWKNTDELDCAGCHHRRLGPRRETECFCDETACLDFTVNRVIDTFLNAPFGNKPVLTDANRKRILRLDDLMNTIIRLTGHYYRSLRK